MTAEPIGIKGRGFRCLTSAGQTRARSTVRRRLSSLAVTEVDDEGLLHDNVSFDIDDIAAAFAELDARYLDGEAAAYARTWSVVAGTYATLNSRQMPARTPDCVMVDRRSSITYEGDAAQFLNATWEMAPDITFRIEAVHHLNALGAVIGFTSSGTSEKGFTAQWRALNVLTIEGDLISRGEVFDEDDLEAAARTIRRAQPTDLRTP